MGNKITFEGFCTKTFGQWFSREIFGLTGNVIRFNVISGHNLMLKLRSFAHRKREFGVIRQPHKRMNTSS